WRNSHSRSNVVMSSTETLTSRTQLLTTCRTAASASRVSSDSRAVRRIFSSRPTMGRNCTVFPLEGRVALWTGCFRIGRGMMCLYCRLTPVSIFSKLRKNWRQSSEIQIRGITRPQHSQGAPGGPRHRAYQGYGHLERQDEGGLCQPPGRHRRARDQEPAPPDYAEPASQEAGGQRQGLRRPDRDDRQRSE